MEHLAAKWILPSVQVYRSKWEVLSTQSFQCWSKKSIFTHGNYSNMSYTRSNKICCETEILTEHRPSQEMHYYGLNTQEVTSNDVAINLMQAVKATTAGSNGYDCYTNGWEMYLLNQNLATKCQLQSEGQRGNRFICGRGFRNIPLKFEHHWTGRSRGEHGWECFTKMWDYHCQVL